MTRTYQYTFQRLVKKEGADGHKESDWEWQDVTLTKKVTDRMEERGDMWKKTYAANWFTQVIRTKYGNPRAVVFARKVQEV